MEDPGAEKDPFLEARAYNYSIYVMVAMPYMLLGGIGFMIWRAVRQKDRSLQLPGPGPAGAGGQDSCLDPSPGDVS